MSTIGISGLISTIDKMKTGSSFKKYIKYIQFPFFRNLELNTRIDFEFPLTVFVGQNGCGKSSTLHALYGAPKWNTPYEFWFSTDVDPIQEVSEGGHRHCFFYVYKDEKGKELEVLKLRILKRDNPDYWETSRPVLNYGMKRLPEGIERNEPLTKKVIYIDFRSELSAFDKYFYFKTPKPTSKSKNKQEYLRRKATTLAKIINGEIKISNPSNPQNKILSKLSKEELKNISFILGKNYVSGLTLKHKLYEDWGTSVLFTTDFFTYSEAFAGSGEIAAVKLVQEVLKAEQYSLVLLDEPEVSLHPGAQKRLKQFLLEQIRKKQLQVVITTHSPTIIEDLPPQAIKVFTQVPNGKFAVKTNITPEEAFFYIEHTTNLKKNLIVEDALAQEIIEAVLKGMGPEIESLFKINFYPGGESIIKNSYIPVYSLEENCNKWIIFDGDQRKANGHTDPDSILQKDQTTENLKKIIIKQTGSDVKFNPDGGATGGNILQENQLRKKYLKYYYNNVFYFPCQIPEEIIWDEEFAKRLSSPETISLLELETNYKSKFVIFTKGLFGENKEIKASHAAFLKNWIEKKDSNYITIKDIITRIKTSK